MKKWISAGGLVITRAPDQGVWVALLKDWKNRWIIPKGRIELGETLAKCAVREAQEELGLDRSIAVSVLGKLHVQRLFFRLPNDAELQFKLVHVYLMEIPLRAELRFQAEEHFTGAGWFPLDEAERIAYRQGEVFAAARALLAPHPRRRRRRRRRGGSAPASGTNAPHPDAAG